jgi:hypothetical protein
MAPNWTHLVRFIAQEDGQIHLGQVDARKWPDIGLATISGQKVEVKLVKGSVFDGIVTEKILHIAQVNSDGYSHKLWTGSEVYMANLLFAPSYSHQWL